MNLRILDYSAGYPGALAVRNAGYDGVIRYLRKEGASAVKPITAGEYQDMVLHNLVVGFVYQHVSRDHVKEGRAAGQHDATWALARAMEVTSGVSPRAIYFAVDYDAPAMDFGRISQYMQGAADILGRERVGTYGKWAVLNYLFDNNVITYGWQTYAWSSGHNMSPAVYHPQAHLFQRLAQVKVGGISCDVNDVLKSNFGQLPAPVALPQPTGLAAIEEDDVTSYLARGNSNEAFVHNGTTYKYSDLVFFVEATGTGLVRRHIHQQELACAQDKGARVTTVTHEWLDGIPGPDGQPVKLFPWEKNSGGPLPGN
jgi:hypothetical protein